LLIYLRINVHCFPSQYNVLGVKTGREEVDRSGEREKLQPFNIFVEAELRGKFGPFCFVERGEVQSCPFERGIGDVALVSELCQKDIQVSILGEDLEPVLRKVD
jgi:hypothetical protein